MLLIQRSRQPQQLQDRDMKYHKQNYLQCHKKKTRKHDMALCSRLRYFTHCLSKKILLSSARRLLISAHSIVSQFVCGAFFGSHRLQLAARQAGIIQCQTDSYKTIISAKHSQPLFESFDSKQLQRHDGRAHEPNTGIQSFDRARGLAMHPRRFIQTAVSE